GEDLGIGRTGKHSVDRDTRSGNEFGQSPGNTEHCGLGYAIVDHVLGNVEPGFTADKHYTSPTTLHHFRHVVACGANATHDVELEQIEPFAIALIEEVVQTCRAGVIDEDVGVWCLREQDRATFRCRDVGGDAGQVDLRHKRAHLPKRCGDPFFSP